MIVQNGTAVVNCSGLDLDLYPIAVSVCAAMVPGLEIFSERIAIAMAAHWDSGSRIKWIDLGLPTDSETMARVYARITVRAYAVPRFIQIFDPTVQKRRAFFRIDAFEDGCAALLHFGSAPRPISDLTLELMPPFVGCPCEFCHCGVDTLTPEDMAEIAES